MIQTWSEVMSRYQALKPTSRAAKNLNEWGEIFASAYRLDTNRANELWQQLIDLNIRSDLTYAKYFVAQIFNKITDHLELHESAEFLYMNPARVTLLFTQGYTGSTNTFFVYCILGDQIIKGNFSEVFALLELFNRNAEAEVSLGDSMGVCHKLFSATHTLLNPSEGSWFKQYDEVPKDNVIRLYKMCEKAYAGSTLANIAFVKRLMATAEIEKDLSRVLSLLDVCKTYSSNLATDFLYHEREVIPKATALKFLIEYAEENHHLPMDVNEEAPANEKAKARWFRRFFRESEQIRDAILIRRSGWLHDEEEAYLDKLAAQGKWSKWIELLSPMILFGDASYSPSCARYVKNCIECAKPPVVHEHSSGFFTWTVTSHSDDEVFSKFSAEQKTVFAKALFILCYAIQQSDEFDGVYWKVREFILEDKEVLDAVQNMLPLKLLRQNLKKESLCEFGGLLLDKLPTLREKLEARISAKTEALEQEEQQRQAEFQNRANNLYECLLQSSPYKVANSAFMKLPEVSDHFTIMMDRVLNELVAYLNEKKLELSTYICHSSGVCSVHLTDEEGNIQRDTAMIVPRSDIEFSEYILRYTEALYREKVNYSRVDFPAVPAINIKAKYYSFPNGSKGYYRCVNEADQPSLAKSDPNIYAEVQKIASSVVNRYFEERPTELVSLKASYEYKPKKPIVEEIEEIINSGAEPEKTLGAVFNVFRHTTPTNKKTKVNAISSLAWDYWVLHAPSTTIKYADFSECFTNAKWDWAHKKALASGNYAAAFDYLTKYHSIFSKRLRQGDDQRIKNCVVVAMYATDILCRALHIDPKDLFLGQWQENRWTAFANSTAINIQIPSTISNLGNIVVYDTRNGSVCGTYEHTDAQTTIIRYILKLVETTYLDVFGLPQKNSSVEKIDGLFAYERYDDFVALLPKVVIAATTCTSTCEAELVINGSLPELEMSSVCRSVEAKQAEEVNIKLDADAIVQQAFRVCFAMDVPVSGPVKKTYKSFEIDLERQTYRDFLCTSRISDMPVVQEQNKQVLTRFYQLYDSYCDLLQQILDMPIEYDPAFSYTASKLRKVGGGFVGKDLYQLNQIINDSRDFIQWIARVEKGEVIYPDFQPYVPLLYYFIINDRLFADRRDIGLVVMCKVWNHYFDDMPAQDVSLILGWIKDYWLIHCQDISLADFKSLFDRKVVFLNEPAVDILNCNTVLEYYNEICFYRVLHGKLVTKGHRNLFEDVFEVVNRRIAAVWAEYGLSYESMLYQAAGKSTYVFLRAIVTRDIQYPIASRSLKRRVSSDEEYILNENEKTLRLQWEFVTQEYDVAFIKAFMEYTLKLTEYRLRMWLGYSASDSFNVDASSIYKFEQKDATVKKILLDNQNIGRIEKIIYETVAEICESKGVVQRGYYEPFAVFHGAEDYTNEALLAEEEKLDYEGIDPNQRITGKSLEEARQVLLRNQGKLVIEDEEDKPDVTPEPVAVSFDPMELKLLRILIYSDNVAFELQNLVLQNIIPSVLITKINEKAMDLIGDVLVDEEQSPPSIYEDYVEIIQEVLEANE